MRGDMKVMKGKIDKMLEVVTVMERKEEKLRQSATTRNVIPIFPPASQPALINLIHGVPPRYYPKHVLPRPPR